MAVRKRFFTKQLADLIKADLINANTDLDLINTVSIGDVDLMPSPEDLKHRDTALEYLPAVYIKPTDVINVSVTRNKSISSGTYCFTLRYAHYYDIEDTTNAVSNALENAGLVADTLLEDNHFEDQAITNAPQYINLQDNDGNIIGDILATDISRISYDTLETEIFKELQIPVIVVDIEYQIMFRSRYRG